MNVRVVRGWEKRTLRRRTATEWTGPRRLLDMDEHREIAHLYRTRQASVHQLADRFGVSTRTIQRYLRTYPERTSVDDAAKRLAVEAARMGMVLSRDDAIRLASAALTEPVA